MAGEPLLVSGSIALDTLEGEHGVAVDELGGSSLYFGLAASLLTPVAVVAVVGRDDLQRVREACAGRPVDLAGLDAVDGPTFRWRARHTEAGNVDLGREDSIYDGWHPRVPPGFTGWAFAGSMRPERQVEFLEALPDAALRAGDAMLSYARGAPAEFHRLVAASHWFFANSQELAALHEDPDRPDAFRRQSGLRGLCVKAGPRGATVYTEAGEIHVPALRHRPVADTTGAGDALAAGFLGRLLTAPGAGLEDALVHGVALASITIEDVGLRALRRATPELLASRCAEVRAQGSES